MKFRSTNYHPLSVIVYCLLLLIYTASFSQPLFLLSISIILYINLSIFHLWQQWKGYFLLSIPVILLILLINPLVSSYGKTILWSGPIIPVLGKINISLEVLIFSLIMSFKLILIMSIFCLLVNLADSDRMFSFFSRFVPKSAITAIMTSLMIPRMKRDLARISMVMRMRAISIENKGLFNRIKSVQPITKILLLSSLEGSWDIAESMHARGFGQLKRSHFEKQKLLLPDLIIIAAAFFSLVVFVWGLKLNMGKFNFYPYLDNLKFNLNMPYIFSLFIGFLFLPILGVRKGNGNI